MSSLDAPNRFVASRVVTALLVLSSCDGGSWPDAGATLNSLIEAERGFAAAASEQGVRDAFLTHLAEDAVLFRPQPVPGKQYLQASAPTPGLLAWDPEYAEASRDGSLGYTTGPWQYRRQPGAEPVASGRYLTFWRQGEDGTWKAVIDHGIAGPVNDSTLSPQTEVETRISPTEAARADFPGRGRHALQRMDSSLAVALAGTDDRLGTIASPDVRVLREGSLPLSGPTALGSGLPAGSVVFRTAGAGVAASADLGYTYGEYEIAAQGSATTVQRGTYLRGWRRDEDGRWRLAVDLMTALPGGGGQ